MILVGVPSNGMPGDWCAVGCGADFRIQETLARSASQEGETDARCIWRAQADLRIMSLAYAEPAAFEAVRVNRRTCENVM